MKKLCSIIVLFFCFFSGGCQKETGFNNANSSDDLQVSANPNRWGVAYVACSSVGKVGNSESDIQLYSFRALNGPVVIKQYNFHITVSDGSRPITMMSSEDSSVANIFDQFTLAPRIRPIDVSITGAGGQDISFNNMNDSVRYASNYIGNGFSTSFSINYSNMGENNISSGTRVSLTLVSVVYEKNGVKKTLPANLRNRDRMLVNSHLDYNMYDINENVPAIKNGFNKLPKLEFHSAYGDNLLQEFPIGFVANNCKVGSLPKIMMAVSDTTSSSSPLIPAKVTSIGNNSFVITMPTPYLIKESKSLFVDFYLEITDVTVSSSTYVSLYWVNPKYYKWVEVKTSKVFSVDNEYFIWCNENEAPGTILGTNSFWTLRPW